MTEATMKELLEYINFGRSVFDYTIEFYLKWTEFPTVRHLAKKFKKSQKYILQVVEDNDDMDYNIGIKTYSGHYEYENIGDYIIEAWKDD